MFQAQFMREICQMMMLPRPKHCGIVSNGRFCTVPRSARIIVEPTPRLFGSRLARCEVKLLELFGATIQSGSKQHHQFQLRTDRMEAVHAAPDLADFNILSEHQEQTPSSFFGGKPVLHLSARAATLKVSSDVFAARPELNQLTRGNATAPRDGQVFIENVDVWVTSR